MESQESENLEWLETDIQMPIQNYVINGGMDINLKRTLSWTT